MMEYYCITIPEPTKIQNRNYPFTPVLNILEDGDIEIVAFSSLEQAIERATQCKQEQPNFLFEVRKFQYSRDSIRPDYFQYVYGTWIFRSVPEQTF